MQVQAYQVCMCHDHELVIFEGLIFCALGSKDNFMGSYFHGIHTYSNHLVIAIPKLTSDIKTAL